MLPIVNWFRFCLLGTVTLWTLWVPAAQGGNDESFVNYLRDNRPIAADCFQYSPGDLMIRIAEKYKLGNGGTPGHEQDVVELFFTSYKVTLQREVDGRYPKAQQIRRPLQKLHCLIFDFMSEAEGTRTYVTQDRIAAQTEYVIAQLYSSLNTPPLMATKSHPSDNDVATFARIKASLKADGSNLQLDFDRFATNVLSQLKQVEESSPEIEASALRLYVIEFIDHFSTLLNPTLPGM
jgi:hypothetical protein